MPYIVLFGPDGAPIFSANDLHKIEECATKGLCSICGQRLLNPWFVSGSRSFLHERGAFVDPPVHLDCAEYALQVCPFLASPSWGKSVAEAVLAQHNLPMSLFSQVSFTGPLQPEWFALGKANIYQSHRLSFGHYRFMVLDWSHVEFWKNGRPCNAPSAEEMYRLIDV